VTPELSIPPSLKPVTDGEECAPPPPGTQQVEVVCPEGTKAGQTIVILVGDAKYDVVVPDGVEGGSTFRVEVPVGL
jgi:hypothetical protein